MTCCPSVEHCRLQASDGKLSGAMMHGLFDNQLPNFGRMPFLGTQRNAAVRPRGICIWAVVICPGCDWRFGFDVLQ